MPTALNITNPTVSDQEWNLTIEVAQHIGESSCRCVAMDSTDGLRRNQPVRDTGKPIMVPVGEGVLGRIVNVTGDPVDEAGPIDAADYWPIHRDPPAYEDLSTEVESFETAVPGCHEGVFDSAQGSARTSGPESKDKWQPGTMHIHDLNATILHQLGIDHRKLTYRYQGRDFRLTDVHGHVVKDIIA